ncbi:alpha/beta-hydrolase [Myriangium duriaei CBS 260.36]|uniref:Alpha/beta-hydrolase n=1 Tax=Myriangium duriaei CBS 260.36 TaxID=1168546 RepID=A0A9P4MDH6_9PEZI|nr:alpha/beta-hydrolase [Myriangium duriaei CBS 260.36]
MEYPSSETRTITVPRGLKYGLVYIPPKQGKPTLLFLHGFPNFAYDWRHQINCFRREDYGIIAPDLLGYGSTDKPRDHHEYRMKAMAGDVVAILDELKVDEAIGVGHDWGSALLSAISAYHPTRISAYAYLAVGYSPPGRMPVEEMNERSKQSLGYEAGGYIVFFCEPDSASLLDRNVESTSTLIFSDENPKHWEQDICPPGAARAWLEKERTAALPGWFDADYREKRNRIIAQGGYTGPLNWYKSATDHFNDEDAASIPEEHKGIRNKPVLFIKDLGTAGAVPADMMEAMTRPFCTDLTVRAVDAGHWLMLEQPDEVNEALAEFLQRVGDLH